MATSIGQSFWDVVSLSDQAIYIDALSDIDSKLDEVGRAAVVETILQAQPVGYIADSPSVQQVVRDELSRIVEPDRSKDEDESNVSMRDTVRTDPDLVATGVLDMDESMSLPAIGIGVGVGSLTYGVGVSPWLGIWGGSQVAQLALGWWSPAYAVYRDDQLLGVWDKLGASLFLARDRSIRIIKMEGQDDSMVGQ